MVKKIFVVVFGGILFNFFATNGFSEEIKKTETKTFNLAFGGYVSVQGDEGFITVNSWDKPEVKLVMTKRAWGRSKEDAEKNLAKLEIRIEEDENHLDIKLVKPKENQNFSFWDIFDPDTWQDNWRSPTADFELTVPQQCNLKLINDEGDVTVRAVTGDVEIHVDEGDIQLRDLAFNEMNLSIDEGDVAGVNLLNPDGRFTIEVDEGEISLDNVIVRRLRVECDEGNIVVKNLEANSCSIATDEGDIELTLSLRENDHYRLNSDEGNITCYLPQRPDVRLDLETEDGGLSSDFDIQIQRNGDGRICQDKLGSGAALIEAATDEGTIAIRKQ
jgi:hypothetical protein